MKDYSSRLFVSQFSEQRSSVSDGQRDGRVHLRRNGPRLSGCAGRGLPIANRWILVRHDRIRPRLLQEFQVPADVQQTSPRLQGQRYHI